MLKKSEVKAKKSFIMNPGFVEQIKEIVKISRENAVKTVDFHRVIMYWSIGKKIFEEEQGGEDRAEYGKYIVRNLSSELEKEYGSGFSIRQLELSRQFYRTFPNANALHSQLNWTHYRLLIRIKDDDKKDFYISETIKNNWNVRQLERQINSHLYERLLISSNKDRVLAVAKGEVLPEFPSDIIKDPMLLEFLGLKSKHNYYEKDVESAIITNLQDFLLELGNGFSFVARQKRIHLDGDDFYVDLVFYNRLLRCFVILELKTHKLTHQDLGQLQMYVNYFDRTQKLPEENSTIGILLSASKNDAVVEFTLPENNKTILASQYELYLPSKETLEKELNKTLKNVKKTNIREIRNE